MSEPAVQTPRNDHEQTAYNGVSLLLGGRLVSDVDKRLKRLLRELVYNYMNGRMLHLRLGLEVTCRAS